MSYPADIWPPPNYFWSEPTDQETGVRVRWCSPLSVRGDRVCYQLPEAPVVAGQVTVSGYLFADSEGNLLDRSGAVAGVIDFDNGLFEVDLSVSPGATRREVQYVLRR